LIYRRVDHPLKSLGSGFSFINKCATTHWGQRLNICLDDLALYTLGVDDYVAGRSMRPGLSTLCDQRNYVQHNLLSLLSSRDIEQPRNTDQQNPFLTVCHFAGLLYSFTAVFPIPAAPFHTLVSRVRQTMATQNFAAQWEEAPRLLLWILYISGIAALGMPDREWFVGTLDRCLRRLRIESWETLREVMLEFLWLPLTNDGDGMDFWEEIEQSNPLGGVGIGGVGTGERIAPSSLSSTGRC
jgi:hypothetical protein